MFKVHARRSSTVYPKHSIEINQFVGAVLYNFPIKVQTHNPDIRSAHVVQGNGVT